MKPPNDKLEDLLVDEWISEVADKFFGSRKRLEEMIEIFQAYVSALRQKEKEVAARAAELDWFLLKGKASRKFYRSIASGPMPELSQPVSATRVLPRNFPAGLTLRKRYTKLVLMAYDGLQKGCSEYTEGVNQEEIDADDKPQPAYYNLVLKMCDLINQRIQRVNDGTSSGTLQYIKRFDPDMRQKARITGAVSGDYARSWERKLRFQPIDFNALNLTQFPRLPNTKQAGNKIIRFCRQICVDHKPEVRAILNELKKQIQTAG